MATSRKTLAPNETAFNKLYFVNMFQPAGARYSTFNEAEKNHCRMAEIANKLTAFQLSCLIDKIESIQ